MQWRPAPNMAGELRRLSVWVDLPACGYEVFELARVPRRREQPDFVAPLATPSEIGFGISSIKATDGMELLAAPIGLVVISDTSDTWGGSDEYHGVDEFRKEMGRPQLYSSLVVENGPVTRVTRHRARWQNSDIVMEIAQFAGIDLVELRFVIDWHEHEQILKLEIPTALTEAEIHAKVPGAVMRRTTNGYEEPYQDWVAVSGKRGKREYTLALMNDSTYSYDCLEGLLRTILIHSAPFARDEDVPHNDTNAWQDQGRQERRFWIQAHAGRFDAMTLDRLSREVQTPAEHIATSAHSGSLPWRQSFLEITPTSVEVLAIKKTEHGDADFVVRLQERTGRATQASLKSLPLGLDHQVSLKAWQIQTWLIRVQGGTSEMREVSELEI